MVTSISKTPVDRATAELIVRDAFGDGVSLVDQTECEEGWFNAAYRLTLSDGRRCVLKVAPPPSVQVLTYEYDIMATEVAGLRLAAERTTMPVPKVLWSDRSGTRLPSPLFVMEFCPGQLLEELRPTLNEVQQRIVDRQLAGYLRQLHDISHPTFGRQEPTAQQFDRWSDAFFRLFDDALADGERAGVSLPVSYDDLRTFVQAQTDALDEVTVPSFVHWDMWDLNVFADPDSLAVVGIIDFERALWADPLMEAQFFLHREDGDFTAAYGRPMFDTPTKQRRRLLYDLYLFVVMVVEVAYRHYPDDYIDTLGRTHLTQTLTTLGLA